MKWLRTYYRTSPAMFWEEFFGVLTLLTILAMALNYAVVLF